MTYTIAGGGATDKVGYHFRRRFRDDPIRQVSKDEIASSEHRPNFRASFSHALFDLDNRPSIILQRSLETIRVKLLASALMIYGDSIPWLLYVCVICVALISAVSVLQS